MPVKIPLYSALSPKHRQYVHLSLGALVFGGAALFVSNFIGPTTGPGGPPPDLPKPKPLGGAPGSALEPRDAWMGGAGKEVAQLKADLRETNLKLERAQGELKQTSDALRAQMTALTAQAIAAQQTAGQGQGAGSPSPAPPDPAAPARTASGPGGRSGATNAPAAMPSQRAIGFPPGTPNAGTQGPPSGPPQAQIAPSPPVAPTLMRVSLKAAPTVATANADNTPSGQPSPGGPRRDSPRLVGQFLPVGFTRAVLLGGLEAPTGGQAQSNPIPVLLRLTDLSVLPNGFRGQTKGCLVVGEGYGDHSSERAYIRATLLSCVLNDGRALETPIVGSIFGDDGMNGISGRLVTKQGAILGNALLAGLASGFGSGIAAATQQTSSTALGTVTSTPTDANSILRAGFGNGVSKALDRMSQYWISLAEKTFPVVEVQPGRPVDLVLQKGVSLEAALAAFGPGGAAAAAPARGTSPANDRAALMRASAIEDDED